MEFSRWGFDRITRISDRYHAFKEFLADVLEGERALLEVAPDASSETSGFQVRDDFARLLMGIGAKDARVPATERFARLAPYFEAGFLLKREGGRRSSPDHFRLETMFLFGRTFIAKKDDAPDIRLASLPPFARGGVFRARVTPILKLFRLDGLEILKSTAAFAFRVDRGRIVILLCNRPHPWQVGAIESAYRIFHPAENDRHE